MKELVIISGKGGTGKTSVVGSFAALACNPVLADCDVDAADLHLILQPEIRERHDFRSGHEAIIRQQDCIGCGVCLAYCRFDAVRQTSGVDAAWFFRTTPANCNDCDFCVRSCPVKAAEMVAAMRDACGDTDKATFLIDPISCEGCGVCVDACPAHAIDFPESLSGEWYLSDTRHGPMVHARLGITAENSGKLVSLVRQEARQLAEAQGRDLILVDGPPGIGCPVIASITGASMVLIVTEPTLSGKHDMQRVIELTRHFRIPAALCVNKWDLNPGLSATIEAEASAAGVTPLGRIRYDASVTAAQIAGTSVWEFTRAGAAQDIEHVWHAVARHIGVSSAEAAATD